MAYPYQRHDSLQFKLHHRLKGVKQYKRWTPLIAVAALIFLAFLLIDSRNDFLVVRSPDASQSVIDQILEDDTPQTTGHETENLTQDLVPEEILLTEDPIDRVKPAEDLVTENRTQESVTEDLVAENRTEEVGADNRADDLVTEDRTEELATEEIVTEDRKEEFATEGDAGENSTNGVATTQKATDVCKGTLVT